MEEEHPSRQIWACSRVTNLHTAVGSTEPKVNVGLNIRVQMKINAIFAEVIYSGDGRRKIARQLATDTHQNISNTKISSYLYRSSEIAKRPDCWQSANLSSPPSPILSTDGTNGLDC